MPTAGTLPDISSVIPVSDLGKYRLIAELARGGMGIVHLAVVQGLAGFTKLLVVKELRSEFLDDDAFVSMFFDEARVAARLNHPNIVQTIEVGSEGRRHFIAMEYLEGQSLQRVIRRARQQKEPLALGVHLRILVEVLSALDYAHSLAALDGTPLGLVHRDVSPHNVFVTYEGHIKLVDFGIAKVNAMEETRGGVLKGKTTYMAPEQAACEPVDRRADLFAVGLMLWEAIVGRRPWEGQNDVAILRSLLSGSVPQLEDALPGVDSTLAAIVQQATSADAENRYPNALAMRDDLESYMATCEGAATGTRDLAALVSQLFAEDRQELQTRIDAQLRTLGDLDREPVSGISSSPTKPSPSDSVPSVRVETASGSRLSRPSGLEKADEGPASVAPSAIWSPVQERKRRKGWLVGSAVAAAATVAVVVSIEKGLDLRWARLSSWAARPPAVNTTSTSAPRPVHMAIAASPSSARLYLDDIAVSNPYVGDRAIDAAQHRVRAEAPGYVTKTAGVTLSGPDVDLSVTLDRAADPPANTSRRAPAKTISTPAGPNGGQALGDQGSARPPAAGEPSASKPARDIDTDNPYPR
jgi:serine/threonine protein kinase